MPEVKKTAKSNARTISDSAARRGGQSPGPIEKWLLFKKKKFLSTWASGNECPDGANHTEFN